MTTPSDREIIASITDDLPVGIWVARAPGGEFVHANRTFVEIMGMGARDDVAAGEYAAPYGIHTRTGELYPESRMPFLRALEAGETVVVDDIVIHRPDGGRVYIRATAKPVRDAAGVITHVVIAFIDISREVLAEQARHRSEAELERRTRIEAVGKLAAGVAHDFNNILTVIRGLAGGLARDEVDPARREDLALIDDAIGSAASLVRSLLDFSRRRPARIERLSINDPVALVLGMLERTSDRAIAFSRELSSARAIVGDHGALEQVVMNLVVNACEAMPDGGRVHVATYDAMHDGRTAVFLEVSDTGHGIPPAARERIFEPYVTTREGTSRRGTGLGLATVSGIVEGHGGEIAVARSDASGTTMRARFPALDDAPSPSGATPTDEPWRA